MKLLINCLVVAALNFGGIMLIIYSPLMDWSPYRWSPETLGSEPLLVLGNVYRIMVWVVGGALVAFFMLWLQPRNVPVYSLVSAATFIVTLGSWHVVASGDLYNALQEFIWVITVPCLYWAFVSMARRRHKPSPGPVG